MRTWLVAGIRLYQKTISPDHGWLRQPGHKTCRFTPTCSEYAIEAIMNHGIMTGGWISICRIGRCHPWHPGGYDPPPPRSTLHP